MRILGILLLLFAAACGDDGGDGGNHAAITITSPSDGSTIDTFSFDVFAASTDPAVPGSALRATLNGTAVSLTADGLNARATIEAGPPLRDENELVITVGDTSVRSRFQYQPPKARAVRIERAEQLLRGPMAHNQIGDYLLSNTVARFVVQDAGKRELANVGTYGGNLIDAELVDQPGRDNFLEITPMINIESVVNAQRAEIVNDGQDGTAAIVRMCGPDDLLDFINPSSNIRDLAGVTFPPSVDDADYDIEACTDYILEPGVSHVGLTTAVLNNTSSDIGLYVGDFIGAAGSLAPWQVSARNRNGIGEVLVLPVSAFSLIGFDDSDGLDYSYVPVPLPGSPIQTSDVLSISGVNTVLHSHSVVQALAGQPPNFIVPANGSRSFSRYFGVGNGHGANAVELANEVMGVDVVPLRGCVTIAGEPAPGARVAIGPSANGAIIDLVSHYVAGADGCFSGTIAPGTYGAAAAELGVPFESSGTRPLVRTFEAKDEEVVLSFDLPAPALLNVTVRDQDGKPVPARVTLLGFDASPEPRLSTAILTGTASTQLFRDEGMQFGITRLGYTGADGKLSLRAEPGDYVVAVSRGAEYSLFTQRVQLASGRRDIDARIARVIDTEGFVSSDFHVHGLNSTDSRTSNHRRVAQYAGEGIENIVMTDHHGRTDLQPTIKEMGLEDFVHATIGEEITTWEYGHFNGYPFDLVPGHQSGGSVDWAGAAPAGQDFPSKGSYSGTPADLDRLAKTSPGNRATTMVQANHVDSYYPWFKIDTSAVPPRSGLTEQEKRDARLNPSIDNFFHAFPAIEIINGDGRRHQERFFNSHIGIWFNLLNQGIITSGTGVTDSHGYDDLNAAGVRTWSGAPSDNVTKIDPDQVAEAIADGHATVGQGAYLEVELRAADGSSKVAGLRADQSNTVASANGRFDLHIRVQSPLWAEFDRIDIFSNSTTVPSGTNDGVNVNFTANPNLTLRSGTDFEIERKNVAPEVAGGERFEANVVVPFENSTSDAWIVVAVRGTDGVSRPLFPVAPADLRTDTNKTLDDLLDGNLDERGVMAVAVSNPLYADTDGRSGFQAPLAPR